MKEQKKKQMHTQNYREVPQFTTPHDKVFYTTKQLPSSSHTWEEWKVNCGHESWMSDYSIKVTSPLANSLILHQLYQTNVLFKYWTRNCLQLSNLKHITWAFIHPEDEPL
jgi:hypothetical protein